MRNGVAADLWDKEHAIIVQP